MAVLSLVVFWWRHLLDGGDDQALVGAPSPAATDRVAAAADEGLIGFEKAMQRARRVLAQPMPQLVHHRPGRLIRYPEFALQELGRDPALVAAHQVGSEQLLHEIGAGAIKYGPRGHRFLAVASGAFIDPWPRLAAMPGAHRTRRRQTHPASAAPPSVRCTVPPPQSAPQTPEAPSSDPPSPIGVMLLWGEVNI